MHYENGYKAYSTLADMLDYNTGEHSKSTALQYVDGTQSYTYGELGRKVEWLTARLAGAGMGVGDKAVILAENMPNWVVAFLALTTSGRVAVPLQTNLTEAEIEELAVHSDSRVAFVSEKMMDKMTDALKGRMDAIVSLDTFDFVKAPADARLVEERRTPAPDDLAAILYTSGSSGRPKGVMLSHKNFCHNVLALKGIFSGNVRDSFLSILPLSHVYELTLSCLFVLSVGANISYFQKPLTPSNLLSDLKLVRPSYFNCVPLVLKMLFGTSAKTLESSHPMMSKVKRCFPELFNWLVAFRFKRMIGGKCRFLGIGGSKLSPDIEKYMLLVRMPYAIGYGMTETAPLVFFAKGKNRGAGSIGVPVYGVEAKIDRPNSDGVGELLVKGDNVMLGYYKDPELTAEAIDKDGWFHTNDLAQKDHKGLYYLKGRKDNVIVMPSGENVCPEEIEKVVNTHAQVEESLVVGYRNQLVALVKLKDGVGYPENPAGLSRLQNELLAFANQRISDRAKLTRVIMMKEPFEKTETFKIKRYKYSQFVEKLLKQE